MEAQSLPEPEPARKTSANVEQAASALTLKFLEQLDEPLLYKPSESSAFQDVEMLVRRLSVQLSFLRQIDKPIPCLVINPHSPPIPIDILPTGNLPSAGKAITKYWYNLYARSKWLRQVQALEGEAAVRDYDEGAARGFFKSRLFSFLFNRIRGLGMQPPASPGLMIRVDTETSGLRVYYSESCFFDPRKALSGELTSPVTGWLQPGWYLFGLAVPGDTPRFDLRTEYEVPPCYVRIPV